MELKNVLEDIVFSKIDEIVRAHSKVCGCDLCKYDIAALALNSLPPRYVVTQQGETYTRIREMEQQFNTDILTAVSNAIKIVKSRPRHS